MGQGKHSAEVGLRKVDAGHAQVLVVVMLALREKLVKQEGQLPFEQLVVHSCGQLCCMDSTRRVSSVAIILEEAIYIMILYRKDDEFPA
jgi:hypothetical protein